MRHCEEAVFFYSYQSWPLFDQLHSNCKLPLTPACLTTFCCLATFPFSDVKQTVFALLPGNWTDTFIDIYIYIGLHPLHLHRLTYIYIYGYKYIFRSISRGSRYGRARRSGLRHDGFINLATLGLRPRFARNQYDLVTALHLTMILF